MLDRTLRCEHGRAGSMKARGWRRIGIVLSVLAFFPLGIFLWNQPSGNNHRSSTIAASFSVNKRFPKAALL